MALRCARTICYVEYEGSAVAVLEARMRDHALDDAPIWTDAKSFDGTAWRGCVDGLLASYPCQPFSVAGKRLGVNDPRHLWPSIERIIGEVEPSWCFFENVGGHLRLGYFDVVKPGLERLGYGVAEGLFTASEVGAPHQRERLFILGHRDVSFGREAGEQHAGQLTVAPGGGGMEHASDFGYERGGASRRSGGTTLEDTISERGRSGNGRRADATDAHAPGQAFPPGPGDTAAWRRILADHPEYAPAIEPGVRGMADGLASGMDLSRTARLRITGNGVVPQCAALALRTLWGKLVANPDSDGEGERLGGHRGAV